MWCQNRNFGDPHSCLVGKYKPFGKKNSFLVWKKPFNPSAQDLKIQWEIHILIFLNIDRNALPKKNVVKKLYKTLKENCFWIWFWTSGSALTIKHALSLSCIFWLGHFPRSKIKSKSSFLVKSYLISKKNNFNRYCQYLKKEEKNYFHCIFKSCTEGFKGFFFRAMKLIFSPNGLYLPTKQPWGCPKFWFWHHHL